MNDDLKTILNYVCLVLLFMVYLTFCIPIIQGQQLIIWMTTMPKLICLAIFIYPLIHITNVLEYILPITLWTLGFMLLFTIDKSAVAGAILLLGVLAFEAFVQYQKKKNEPQERP